jgi:hypothetical protein
MSAWEKFAESGSVADYLAYAAIKGLEHADSERRGSEPADMRGTGPVH